MFKRLPTFKSLPQAIGLPFLSSQEDAQLKFKSGENGIKRLASDEVISLNDVSYWAQYYRLFNSAADVYSLISAQDVRQVLSTRPQNLSNLITILSHHLFTLLPSPLFPTSAASSSSSQDPTKEALNCLRVLGRILVVVYEAEGEAREHDVQGETFGGKYLWKREIVTEEAQVEDKRDGSTPDNVELKGEEHFEIGDEDSDDDDEGDMGVQAFKGVKGNPPVMSGEPLLNGSEEVKDPLSQPAEEVQKDEVDEEANTMPCLVDRLFSCTVDLLFCAGFTVPESVRGEDGLGEKINYVIWEKGIGSTVNVGSTADLDRNKTEVLRFLIILLSTTIYTPAHLVTSTPNLPLSHLTHSLERRLVLSLLCSFLNTSLAPTKPPGLGSNIPYNHLISKTAEERRTLVRGCMMVLLVALDYREVESGVTVEMGEAKDENAFRYFISKLHRKEDFAFLLAGILGILEENSGVQSGYLPGSKKPVPYVLETFMLLWRIVDLNKRFRAYLYDTGRATDIIGYVILACLELKDDPAHHGLLRLLSYLLQTLSADQAFANALNQPLRLAVPAKWAVPGTLADFLIVSTYSIATTPGLNPLFPALTISIANVAPYLQNVGVQASTRLLQLFKAFSAPNFLLADEGHPRLVYYLLETFNSILYHQLNENPNVVYALLRSHQDFQTLATFSLVSGLRDIQRRKAMRASIDNRQKESTPGITRTQSELDMLAEKAALLGREIDGDTEPPSSPINARPISDRTQSGLESLSLTSPTAEIPEPSIQPMSEKARGKMRATESVTSLPTAGENDIGDDELMRLAQGGVGPNGYVPTQEWVSSWQKGLPLDPVLVAISELLPKIQDSTTKVGAPSSKVINLLKTASLVDVLPPAQPVVPRKFQWSTASYVWLTSLLWGDIYVAGLTSIGIWRDTTVRLFGVRQAPRRRGGGEQVGRVLKMIGVV